MIIGVCGFTGTGSSAVVDILKEFTCNSVLDSTEFLLPYGPDGLQDLDYQLNTNCSKYTASAVGIERFRRHVYIYLAFHYKDKALQKKIIDCTESFISKITQEKWLGYGGSDYALYSNPILYKNHALNLIFYKVIRNISAIFTKKLGREWRLYPRHTMEFSIKPDNFDEYSKNYIIDLLSILGCDFKKNIILDQPFAGNNPTASFKYFDNPKAIILNRDPIDLYLLVKCFYRRNGTVGYQVPADNVSNFITYYKKMNEGMDNAVKNENVLKIQFEDLIYNYESTLKKIIDFCNLDTSTHAYHFFDPKISIANTQLRRKFNEYNQDVDIIQEELKDYLYDFSPYVNMDNAGLMFLNQSPLNKLKHL